MIKAIFKHFDKRFVHLCIAIACTRTRIRIRVKTEQCSYYYRNVSGWHANDLLCEKKDQKYAQVLT